MQALRLANNFSRSRTAAAGCGCCGTPDPELEPPPLPIQPVGVAGQNVDSSGSRLRNPSTTRLSPIPCAAADVGSKAKTGSRQLNVNLPDIQFSACHFVASQGFRERVHGHNYGVQVKLGGHSSQLQADGYIVDFGDVKQAARNMCKPLNGRTLIPTNSDVLQMQESNGQLDILCEDGARMSFPTDDCAMLPIVHTTAEEISEHIWGELVGGSHNLGPMLRRRGVEWCEVWVFERPGQGASFRGDIPSVADAAIAPVGKITSAAMPSLVPMPTASPVVFSGKTPSAWDGAAPSAWDGADLMGDRPLAKLDAAFQSLIDASGPRVAAEAAFRSLLKAALGPQEASRPELTKTPARAAKAFFEQTSGLTLANPLDAVGEGVFDLAETRDLVSVRDVQFHSLCEHHLLPFSGRAHFAYIPDGRVLGLSKFARLLDVFARRPQVQERLTRHVAEALVTLLKPRAVAVSLNASHCCMSIRGVGQSSAETRTLAILGPDKDDPATKKLLLGILGPSSRL